MIDFLISLYTELRDDVSDVLVDEPLDEPLSELRRKVLSPREEASSVVFSGSLGRQFSVCFLNFSNRVASALPYQLVSCQLLH